MSTRKFITMRRYEGWMVRTSLSVLCLGAITFGQVRAPSLGFVRYSDRTAHPISGSPASFIVGASLASAVDAASYSDGGGIVSAEGRIIILQADGTERARTNAEDHHAVVNASHAFESAVAWLPGTRRILIWTAQGFHTVEAADPLPGDVLSLRVDPAHIFLLVAERGGSISEVTIDRASGQQQSTRYLAGVTAPAIYIDESILFTDNRELKMLDSNGSVRPLPSPTAPIALERMSDDWVHIRALAPRSDWALRLTGGREHLSELPVPEVRR